MSKLFKNLVKVTPLVLGASVAAAGSAVAQTMPGTPQLKVDPAAHSNLIVFSAPKIVSRLIRVFIRVPCPR